MHRAWRLVPPYTGSGLARFNSYVILINVMGNALLCEEDTVECQIRGEQRNMRSASVSPNMF